MPVELEDKKRISNRKEMNWLIRKTNYVICFIRQDKGKCLDRQKKFWSSESLQKISRTWGDDEHGNEIVFGRGK
jgi:hypothetical protein